MDSFHLLLLCQFILLLTVMALSSLSRMAKQKNRQIGPVKPYGQLTGPPEAFDKFHRSRKPVFNLSVALALVCMVLIGFLIVSAFDTSSSYELLWVILLLGTVALPQWLSVGIIQEAAKRSRSPIKRVTVRYATAVGIIASVLQAGWFLLIAVVTVNPW